MIYDSFDHLGKQRNHLFFCEKKQQHSLFIPFRASCTDAQKTQQAMPHPIAIGVLLFEFSTWRCRYLSSELQRAGFSWPCACWLIIILSYYLDIIFMLLNIISYTTSYYYIYSGNLVANKSFTAPKLYCIQSFLGANKFASLLNHNICIRSVKKNTSMHVSTTFFWAYICPPIRTCRLVKFLKDGSPTTPWPHRGHLWLAASDPQNASLSTLNFDEKIIH